MINLSEPDIQKKDIKKISQLILSKKLIDGHYQRTTEKLIKKILKVNYVALTQSCSDALEAASLILDLKKGDEVLLPSYTFSSTANSFMLFGAKPVFVDINTDNLNIDLDDLNKKITERTKAIYVVHYGGVSCDIDELMKIVRRNKLFLVEDVAHSFLGKYKNKYYGKFGDIAAFSFHASKNFTGGQCGALIVNNKKLIKNVDNILDKGNDRKKKLGFKNSYFKSSTMSKNYYQWQYLGSEYRASEIASCILYCQLLRKEKIQNKRKKFWSNYRKFFEKMNFNNLRLIKYHKKISQAYHHFLIILKDKYVTDQLIKYLQSKNIAATFHYIPLHMSPYFKSIYKSNHKLKNTENLYSRVVRLPLHSSLTVNDFNFIKKKLYKFFSNK